MLAIIVSLAGVICGHIALHQIKRHGGRGRGLAIAALIIGYLGIALGILLTGFWLLTIIAEAQTLSYTEF